MARPCRAALSAQDSNSQPPPSAPEKPAILAKAADFGFTAVRGRARPPLSSRQRQVVFLESVIRTVLLLSSDMLPKRQSQAAGQPDGGETPEGAKRAKRDHRRDDGRDESRENQENDLEYLKRLQKLNAAYDPSLKYVSVRRQVLFLSPTCFLQAHTSARLTLRTGLPLPPTNAKICKTRILRAPVCSYLPHPVTALTQAGHVQVACGFYFRRV